MLKQSLTGLPNQIQSNQKDSANQAETLLRQLIQGFKKDMNTGITLCKIPLTHLEYGILYALNNAQELDPTITAVAEYLHVEPPTLVGSIAKLERKKLITKKQDPKDRRRMPLALTASGKSLIRKIFDPTIQSFSRAFDRIGSNKTQQFLSILREIVESRSD
jgi:DNA-binding MarR family transcriptional regulator